MYVQQSMHAERRCQQRGIPSLVLDWLEEFGEQIHDHRGGIVFWFTDKSWKHLGRAYGNRAVARLSEWRNAYLVVSSADGMRITAGFRYKRLPH